MTQENQHDSTNYKKNSISLLGAVSMGTGVMIGAGIFALTGQVAQLAGSWFPLAFLLAAIIVGFSAYSYILMSNAYPSAGGIAMYLKKAYGKSAITGACALLMYFSMVINESLVARTFATYTLQLFEFEKPEWIISILAVLVLVFAFLVNIIGNKFIQRLSFSMAFIKIAGLLLLSIAGLIAVAIRYDLITSSETYSAATTEVATTGLSGFLAAVALAVLAYKGFTTITNSGDEITQAEKNISRAIIISLIICVVLYFLVSLTVSLNLSIAEIINAKDYSLAQAARPIFGNYGLWFTVGFAIIATVSGLIASVFAVSRMLAMLSDMKLVPHRHFGLPGDIQKHSLLYTIVLAMLLAIFFDLSRIASLGAILYLVMDMFIHWGVLKHLRAKLNANIIVLVSALIFDLIILLALIWTKAKSDITIVWLAAAMIITIFIAEYWYVGKNKSN